MKIFEIQTIAFFTPKMKTFPMVHINSKSFSRSRATQETLFERPLYVKSRHFGPKRYFIFFNIAQ